MAQQLLKERTIHMSAGDFEKFLAARPKEERWQLIDGDAFMMAPPTGTHQRIAYNLARLLDDALEAGRFELATLQEIGVRIPGRDAFQPVPDLVVADAVAPATSYLERFYLAAEVLSESNTPEYVSLKVSRYAEHPDNLYTLVIDQTAMRCEIWSRENDWKGIVVRGPEAIVDMPEFNFHCLLHELYRNTTVRPI